MLLRECFSENRILRLRKVCVALRTTDDSVQQEFCTAVPMHDLLPRYTFSIFYARIMLRLEKAHLKYTRIM